MWDFLRKNLSIECDRNYFGRVFLKSRKWLKLKMGCELLRVVYRRRRVKLKYRCVGCGEFFLLIIIVWIRFKIRK